ncbi:MAG: beta-ketoacyl synthase N-terminal-like domain-containing protein, partial [Proteobacteria bacterium]|nr:beta-ketoacyl synthase N-terminal-like domain-containing protein [Pseudomonadota bacterium]
GQAIQSADLPEYLVKNLRTGVAYGTLMGGMSAMEQYFRSTAKTGSFVSGIQSSTFLQMMSHTAAANIAMAFGIPGRLIASCVACSASTQSIGFSYELIRDGVMDRMVCGGAEEMHLGIIGCFDVLGVTSRSYNGNPENVPSPFSKGRDGLVCAEGAGTVVLEDYDQAKARGARIFGEILGFYTCTDTGHMTNPSQTVMETVITGALESAGVKPSDVAYVNAHATGTDIGDIAESKAVYAIFGPDTPVSSVKGSLGHMMGACGVVETISCLGMFARREIAPVSNFLEPDPRCAPLQFVDNRPQKLRHGPIVKNSFAFGGINASLVIGPAV